MCAGQGRGLGTTPSRSASHQSSGKKQELASKKKRKRVDCRLGSLLLSRLSTGAAPAPTFARSYDEVQLLLDPFYAT